MPDIVKFDSRVHADLIAKARFSYVTCMPMMDLHGYVMERNGEQFLVWQSSYEPHAFPALFLPKKKENWVRANLYFADTRDIDAIKAAGIEITYCTDDETSEYYYRTRNFVAPTGRFAKKANRFRRLYNPTVDTTCPREEVLAFYEGWFKEKAERLGKDWSDNDKKFDRDFFIFCLDNLEKYGIRQTYVRVGGKLAGMGWGVVHSPGKWVGIHVKVDRQYEDLSRFLQHERAKQFPDCPELTLATGAGPGVSKMKEMLQPSREVPYYTVKTGDKLPPGKSQPELACKPVPPKEEADAEKEKPAEVPKTKTLPS